LVVELIVGVAWPVAAIWIAYLFRKPMGSLLSRMSRFRYKDAEASFEHGLSEAEAKIARVEEISTHKITTTEVTSKTEQLRRIAEVSPRASIMESWILIEEAAGQAGYVQGTQIPRINALLFVEDLVKEGKLPREAGDAIHKLRELRNKAAHLQDFQLSQAEAERYLDLAAKISESISNVSEQS